MPGGYEMHHTNWTRRQWQRAPYLPLRKMRHHPGLIIPIRHDNHRLLHRELDPTPMPIPELADDLLQHLGPAESVDNRIERFRSAAHFLLGEAFANPSPEYSCSAYMLGSHYLAQLGFQAMQEAAVLDALSVPIVRAA